MDLNSKGRRMSLSCVPVLHNNVATLCCAKNRRCESSRVTSPLSKLIAFLPFSLPSPSSLLKLP